MAIVNTATSYTHDQETAASTWNITHNLNTMAPIVDIWVMFEGAKQKMLPLAVKAIDMQNCQVQFTVPRAGTAAVR